MPPTNWTPEQDETIRTVFPSLGPQAVAERLNRSYCAVRSRAVRLGVRTKRRWTPEEDQQLRASYKKEAAAEIAARLRRTFPAVVQRAAALGLADKYEKRPSKTPQFIARYRRLHARGLSDAEIAVKLGTDRPYLNALRRELGLPDNRCSRHSLSLSRARLKEQLARAGACSFAELRHRRIKALNRSYGLPEDLAPRELQIVLVLARGPATKAAICRELGLSYANPQKALNAGNKGFGRNYLSRLQKRGLVARTRMPCRGGYAALGVTGPQWLFMLTGEAMELLAKEGTDANPGN